jgi:hypothetical protein
MEHVMANDLLTKATALLEAREKLPHAEPFGGVEIQEDFPSLRQPRGSKIYGDTAKYLELAANTAPEIITGFQQLLKEKDAIIQTLEDENEMLTESNEDLTKCETERNDLQTLVRRMVEAGETFKAEMLENITAKEEEARQARQEGGVNCPGFNQHLGSLDTLRGMQSSEVWRSIEQVLAEARAALPQHYTTTTP